MTLFHYAPDTIAPAPSWQRFAACAAPDVDPEVFFPDPGDLFSATAAKQTCQACPVRQRCLTDALTSEDGKGATGRFGIRGGLDHDERHRQATGRPARRGRAECGTDAGYRRHIKNGEPVDEACQAAHRAYGLAYYHQTKSRASAAQAEAVA
jgi:hypothetical protein